MQNYFRPGLAATVRVVCKMKKRNIAAVATGEVMETTACRHGRGRNKMGMADHVVKREDYLGCTSSTNSSGTVRRFYTMNLGPCTQGLNDNKDKNVGESTILLQQDHEIQEVPVVVLKTDPTNPDGAATQKSYIDLDPREEAAFIEAFESYHTPQEVLKILDTIPSKEVTPMVSFSILKKLLKLESNFGFRNEGRSWVVSAGNGERETFARAAIVGRLMNTIITSGNVKLILDTLDILRCEKYHHVQDSDSFLNYHERLCDYILVKVTEGKLSLEETCRAVCSFGKIASHRTNFKINKTFVDKMWVGIIEKGNDITVNNIVEVFKTVPYFQRSQRLVFNLVEKKLMALWWRMDSDAVAQFCHIIESQQLNHLDWSLCGRLLKTLAKCTALNMHQVTEDQLFTIIKCFQKENFGDLIFHTALSKYMKAKRDKVTKPDVISLVMDYVKKFRLRSPFILEAVAEFVLRHKGKNLSPPQITSIVTGFGQLNYHPEAGTQFWNIIEDIVEDKFIQFTPRDMINILLACVYLEKHPVNYISRIFSPYFLDRIHANEPYYSDLQDVRSQLKLLDISLHLDSGNKYGGPYLPKDFSAQSLPKDGRVSRAVKLLLPPLQTLCGDDCTIETSIMLPSLPLNDIFIVDALLVPLKGNESQLHNFIRNRITSNRDGFSSVLNFIGIIINIPEHFSSDGNTLVGPQAMKTRHLKTLGLSVVNLKYEEVMTCYNSDPQRLLELLKDKLNRYLNVSFQFLSCD